MNPILATLRRLSPDAHAADAALLSAFLAGDQGAFAALVRRYAGLVFATCRRVLRHQHDAEDAFQAAFLVLARRAADVWPREAVGAWLFGVAHRVALKARTARARRTKREGPLEDVAGSELAPPDMELAAVIQGAVATLPPVYRAAVVACDLDGLTRKEAATRLGWTEGTLSGRLARARALLAARLRKAGVTLPAAGLGAVSAPQVVSAALVQTTCDLTTGLSAAGAPAPVAALAEGVVTNMLISNLKAAAAVLFVACALVSGAVAASGDGPGGGPGGQPKAAAGSAQPAPVKAKDKAAQPSKAAPGPRVELARRELAVARQELLALAKGEVDPKRREQLLARLEQVSRLLDPNDLVTKPEPPVKPALDFAILQGSWQVAGISAGGKPVALDSPADEPLVAIFDGSALELPFRDATAGWQHRNYAFTADGTKTPKTIDLTRPKEPVGRGLYEFTVSRKTCHGCHAPDPKQLGPQTLDERLGVCGPGLQAVLKGDLGLRLALGIDGKRPETFGGDGVIVFDLVRDDPKRDERLAQFAELLKQARTAEEKAELGRRVEALRRFEEELKSQAAKVEQAEAQLAAAKLQFLFAQTRLEDARGRVEAANKALADLQKAAPKVAPAGKDDPAFTVFVRPADGPETAVRLKATGGETVLDALEAAAPNALKSPDAVSVWVARRGKVLAVDLVGITARGVTTTNYVLKPGDRLFVQFAPQK